MNADERRYDEVPETVRSLISAGALFAVNHSGGKDSQAMTIFLREFIPAEQLLVVHAHLPEVEWDGVVEHIENTTKGLAYRECRAGKTFFEMVERRGMFPSPTTRQCTSDLKRGPVNKLLRGYLKQHPEFRNRVVNCMGLRAEESPARAKKITFRPNDRNSRAGREWYDWLPIHHWTTNEVFSAIEAAGQKPHWAYGAGMTRLSCCFCIMASAEDLITAARLRPELYRRYVEMERRLGRSMLMPKKGSPAFLESVTGIKTQEAGA